MDDRNWPVICGFDDAASVGVGWESMVLSIGRAAIGFAYFLFFRFLLSELSGRPAKSGGE